MLELPHTLVGATIATQISQPQLVLPLALISHLATDFLIPHWNPSIYTETKKLGQPTRESVKTIIFDALASILVGCLIAWRFYPNWPRIFLVIMACFLAVLPDVIEFPYFFLNYRPVWLKKLILFQHHHQKNTSFKKGLISQAIVIIICLLIIYF